MKRRQLPNRFLQRQKREQKDPKRKKIEMEETRTETEREAEIVVTQEETKQGAQIIQRNHIDDLTAEVEALRGGEIGLELDPQVLTKAPLVEEKVEEDEEATVAVPAAVAAPVAVPVASVDQIKKKKFRSLVTRKLFPLLLLVLALPQPLPHSKRH
jgi:hypothetical protein